MHPDNQLFIGIIWDKSVYVYKMLPFCTEVCTNYFLSCSRYSSMDHQQWYLLHYLDDFILVADSKQQAEEQKQILVSTCERLGIPLEFSSTDLTFLELKWTQWPGRYAYPKINRLNSKRNYVRPCKQYLSEGQLQRRHSSPSQDCFNLRQKLFGLEGPF